MGAVHRNCIGPTKINPALTGYVLEGPAANQAPCLAHIDHTDAGIILAPIKSSPIMHMVRSHG
jgi:hypothetical protein